MSKIEIVVVKLLLKEILNLTLRDAETHRQIVMTEKETVVSMTSSIQQMKSAVALKNTFSVTVAIE